MLPNAESSRSGRSIYWVPKLSPPIAAVLKPLAITDRPTHSEVVRGPQMHSASVASCNNKSLFIYFSFKNFLFGADRHALQDPGGPRTTVCEPFAPGQKDNETARVEWLRKTCPTHPKGSGVAVVQLEHVSLDEATDPRLPGHGDAVVFRRGVLGNELRGTGSCACAQEAPRQSA